MDPGHTVAERFVIERVAGTGGMGVVYKATDRRTGRPVAIKVARGLDRTVGARLLREAETLASIDHPGIVRHVAHGHDGDQLYVVMEWLEGEDLAVRLSRTGLGTREAISVTRAAAESLAVLHARGIVHRDIKPSNLFLVEGGVKLVDLGIARHVDAHTLATRTGSILGTPGYLAPEQARGSGMIDARCDVFSLGCVAYECLVGRPAFVADHPLALLAKIVIDPAPRLSAVRPDLPPELDALVGAMLAKRPESRPAMDAIAAALSVLGDLPDQRPPEARASLEPAITGSERRLLSVVVVAADTLPTLHATGEVPPPDATWASLRPVAASAGAQLERLADGSLLLCFAGSDAASDQAHAAARAALATKALVPDAAVALATGLALVGDRLPLGDVVDRGAGLLAAAHGKGVRIDDVTRRLLDARFEVVADAHGAVLVGVRDDARTGRAILGRATPFVGREREVSTLAALAAEAFGDGVARVAVVTGESGIGKSRVRDETAARVAASHPEAEVWTARAEMVASASAFAVVGACVRRALGVPEGGDADGRRAVLGDAVERLVDDAEAARVTHFLAEVIGVPFEAGASVALDGARLDPSLMARQTMRAFEDLVLACAKRHPLLVTVEDLQFCDEPSVRLLDAALRRCAEAPLLVLAVARPDVDERFPKLFAEHAAQRVALGPLTKKAAAQLARSVLGQDVAEARIEAFVARARGNPLLLEELLRAEAEGRGGDVPETLLAIVQARLAGLDGSLRRVLRATSVFGTVAPSLGVAALLGGDRRHGEATAHLRDLVERELLERRTHSRFDGSIDFAFRNDLLREASHATLAPEDRVVAHRVAADWLVAAGERDSAVLAAHFDEAHETARAAEAWAQAADDLVVARDLDGAIAAARRAVARGASGLVLARARRAEGISHLWKGDAVRAQEGFRDALALLPAGSDDALGVQAWSSSALVTLGKTTEMVALAESILAMSTLSPFAQARTLGRIASAVAYLGQPALLDRILARVAELTDGVALDPGTEVWVARGRAAAALVDGDVGAYLRLQEQARAGMEAIGDAHGVCNGLVSMGWASVEIGDHARAIELLEAARSLATDLGAEMFVADALQNLGYALARAGRLDEALAAERDAVARYDARGDVRMGGCSRTYLGEILALRRDPEAAARVAAEAVARLAEIPPQRAHAQATLAAALLATGHTDEARRAAASAARTLDELGGIEEGEAIVRLMDARTLDAAGEKDASRATLRFAVARLHERAARIADEAQRASFLANVPAHAETLRLARAWGVE